MADTAPAAAPPIGAPVSAPVASGAPTPGRGSEPITNDTGKSPVEHGTDRPPKTLTDDFKPWKIKAGGKEHEIKSREQMERILQRGLPIHQSLEELKAEKEKLEPVTAALRALAEGDEDSALEVLESLMGDRFAKVAEKRLMREVEREKKMQGYTERERQQAAELERLQAQRSQWERQQTEAKQAAEKQRAEVGITQASQHIAETVGGVLESLGLPKDLGPASMAALRPLISASIAAGTPLDKEALADEVREYHATAVQWAVKGLQGKALLDFFGADVGKAYKAALLEQHRGRPATAPAPNGTPAKPTEPTGAWDPRRRDWGGR
jgi:hypothetical protein